MEKTETITIEIELTQRKIERYQWALSELPYRTDEDWKTHLAYALHDCIDKVIEEANRYQEWRGFPSIASMRKVEIKMEELAQAAQSEDFLDDPEWIVDAISNLRQLYQALFLRLNED